MPNVRRMLVLLIVALLLPLAAACGGGSPGDGEEREPSAAVPTAEAAAETDAETAVTSDESEATAGEAGFNLFGLLTGDLPGLGAELSGMELNEDVDPALKAVLLQNEDLPGGFGSVDGGEFSFTVPNEETGPIDVAMSTFFSGDPQSEMGPFAAVMSAAAALPPEELAQALADFPSGADAEEEIRQALGEAGDTGLDLLDLDVLEASGLGDQGLGLHMVMDLGGLLGGVAGDEADIEEASMSFDMYVFARRGRMLMLMVMWPGDEARPVDGRALAEIMDGRAEEAF